MSYEPFITHVEGDGKTKIFMFTLSTCIWCRKTKQLMKDLGVNYSYVDVDLVEGEKEQEEVMVEMHRFNPATSFPTIVINDGEDVILGYEEDNIKKLVG